MASTITVVCPHCSNRMRASAEHVGRKGRCPTCKALVEIVAAPSDESLVTLRPAAPRAARAADARLGSTNVPAWWGGLIGAAVTTLLYLALFMPLKNTYLGQLFVDRGPMQHCSTLVTCWGLAILALKYLAVRKQMSYAELELELIPLEIGLQIAPSNVDQFLGHLGNLPRAQRLSILGRRIQGALEHFKFRTRVPEVQQYLATQAELDASAVDSGYTLLRAFIWVVPLLGFIGTVTGISSAVTGLDAAVKQGGGDQLMSGLGLVTHGLAVAFDTTFLALVLAIVLLFPTESLRKSEYGMLDRIEAFTNESLLRRMVEEPGAASAAEMPEIVRSALDAAFREHQRWLAQWQAQVAQLGQLIGADFESTVIRVQERISQAESARREQYESLSRMLESVLAKADRATTQWREIEQQAGTQSREFLSAVSQLQHALSETAQRYREFSQQESRLLQVYSESSLGKSLLGLSEQVARLTETIDGMKRAAAGRPAEPLRTLEPLCEPADGLARRAASPQRKGLWGRIFGGS